MTTMTSSTFKQKGFSLPEFLISVVAMLFLMGAVFHVLGKYQRNYQGEQVTADMRQGSRSAIELMSQEVGQAGYLGFKTATITADIVAAAPVEGVPQAAQSVAMSSTGNLFKGEKLTIDTGASQELVTVDSFDQDTFSAIFALNHNQNAPVNAIGAFPEGVLLSSTANKLRFFGDINDDGSLVYVEYTYDAGAGTLSRSGTPLSENGLRPVQIILRNLLANPGGTPFFQYRFATKAIGGKFYIVEVVVTATTQTSSPDPESKQFRAMTSSVVLSPRNVLAAIEMDDAAMTDRMQPTPCDKFKTWDPASCP
jgi:Tfp pilus assembly protein PilV